ncbi:uncharacterized protein AKAME5_000342700 [Lates japonicus]|uniref:Uncharacterized protein n=1 Tax=Lates japonicus TaxID=270547 RepID=A0AAD3M9U1_LATJO|nr:uncharacterized protein AKAME5_000342700 [Lates japonicus]
MLWFFCLLLPRLNRRTEIRSGLFKCEVTDTHSGKVQRFTFSRQSSAAHADEEVAKLQGWQRFIIVSVGLAALIIIVVAVNIWAKTKGTKTQMDENNYLNEFINQRPTAAEEIFRVLKKTIVEYEEEVDRQRRLLDKIRRTDLPQQHVCKEEEVLTERNSSLDQEDPEPLQIKEEQEEICTSHEGEQLTG